MRKSAAAGDEGWVGRALVLAVWFGMAAGIAELALLAVKKYGQGRIIRVSRDVLWMAPLADIALCAVAAVILVLLALRWPRLRSLRVAIAVAAFPAILTVLLHYRPLHIAAKVLLAAGLAVQAGLLSARRPAVVATLMRWSTFGRRRRSQAASVPVSTPSSPALDIDRRRFLVRSAAMLGGLVVGTRGFYGVREWRRLRALPDAASGTPNVLLIVLDTVRAGSLSLYGYERRTTPELERWAARGVTFDFAWATSPWTLPSHASMFTGRWHHEMTADWDDPLDTSDPTLAEWLADLGYATAGFVANPAYTTYESGLDRGFARWEDYPRTPGQIMASSALGATIGCGNRNEAGCRLRGPLHWFELLGRKPAGAVRRRFTDWVDGRDDERPFFAFLNLFDAHVPYLPPAPFDTAFAPRRPRGNPMHLDLDGWEWTPAAVQAEQDAYDGTIAYVDAEVGRLLDELDRRALLERTLVIITSDHGEEFAEHGVMTHGNSLYSPSLHVPMLLLWPGHVPAGVRIPDAVSVRSIAATVADLIGHADAPFAGTPLARYWQREAEAEPLYAQVSARTFRPPSYPVSRGDMYSVFDGRYHYIRGGDGAEELYDVRADIWESHERSREDRTMADSLKALIDGLMGRIE